jgi:hypothetical protein
MYILLFILFLTSSYVAGEMKKKKKKLIWHGKDQQGMQSVPH